MQKSKVIIFILFIISGIFYWNITDTDEEFLDVKILRIIDGDTVETELGLRVRLKGINTPEKGMAGSAEAVEFLSEEILNKSLKIKSFGQDKYGRTLGFLILDKRNINAEILKRGLATLYYYEHDEFYEEMFSAEEFARMNELEIWKKSDNYECLEVIEFEFKEPESLKLKNNCKETLDVLIKDDATHIYKEEIKYNEILEKTFSHIWNDAGDTLYVWDSQGLLLFNRYN